MAATSEEKLKKLVAARDFVKRANEGAPADGLGDEEVANNFKLVSSKLSAPAMEEVTAEAFARLPEDQRSELDNLLKENLGDEAKNVDLTNPNEFARFATNYSSDSGSGIEGLLGALAGGQQGGGGLLSGLLGGLLGGGKSSGSSQGGGLNDLMSNPLIKGLIGAIAAGAMQKVVGGGGGSNQASGSIDDVLGGLLGGGNKQQAGAQQGGNAGSIDDILGGLIGGGQQGGSGQQGGASIDDILGGLIGGGQQGGSGQQGGLGLDDLLGGLIGGGQQGGGTSDALPKKAPKGPVSDL